MGYWGKLLGSVAGFAVGGPFGAVMGAALGHAADNGALPKLQLPPGWLDALSFGGGAPGIGFAGRDQVFSVAVVSLAAKLAKCDGPVTRPEIDAFKRHFPVPPEHLRDVGRLFDQARTSTDDYLPFARRLGELFADRRPVLEAVLAGLHGVAAADGAVNAKERAFLVGTARSFGLEADAWERGRWGGFRASPPGDDPYRVLGLSSRATDEEVREAWRGLMRQHHPDSVASQGAAPEVVARATARVARINAAWDQIKRERRL